MTTDTAKADAKAPADSSKKPPELIKAIEEIANNTTVEGSVLALIKVVGDKINEIPPSSDATTQAALEKLGGLFSVHSQDIADAVLKHTPAASDATPLPPPKQPVAPADSKVDAKA